MTFYSKARRPDRLKDYPPKGALVLRPRQRRATPRLVLPAASNEPNNSGEPFNTSHSGGADDRHVRPQEPKVGTRSVPRVVEASRFKWQSVCNVSG